MLDSNIFDELESFSLHLLILVRVILEAIKLFEIYNVCNILGLKYTMLVMCFLHFLITYGG